jgi:ABC-type phosphate transport system substrate-binding protein
LDVGFTSVANVSAALTRYRSGATDFIIAEAIVFNTSALTAQYGGPFVQLPLTANAVILAFNLPELYSNDTLALNVATLARIWSGQITTWNHADIIALNPSLSTRLPSATIQLAYKRTSDALDADVTAAFIRALSHDSTFASALESAGGTLYGLLNGAGYSSDVVADRQTYVNTTAYALGYFSLKSQSGLRLAVIKDANGTNVAASSATVQTAMSYFRSSVFSQSFVADISGGANGSYPLAYLSSVVLFYKTVNSSGNCPKTRDILDYVAWTQVNDYAVTLAQGASYVALDIAYRRKLIDTLGSITCDGLRATTSAYVIGLGGPVPVYTSWVSEYTDSSLRLKYYAGDALTATKYMQSGDLDFGSTVVPLSPTTLAPMPDVVAVKTCAHAYVWTYNVRRRARAPISVSRRCD